MIVGGLQGQPATLRNLPSPFAEGPDLNPADCIFSWGAELAELRVAATLYR